MDRTWKVTLAVTIVVGGDHEEDARQSALEVWTRGTPVVVNVEEVVQ